MFLPYRLSPWSDENRLPLKLYSIGAHAQPYQSRPSGHPVWQCFIVIEGSGFFNLMDGRNLKIEANQILILPDGQAHEYYPASDKPWLLGYIGFQGSITENMVSGCALPVLSVTAVKDSHKLIGMLKQMWDLVDGSDPTQISFISIRLYEFLLLLSEQTEFSLELPYTKLTRYSDKALQRAAQFMNEHFMENLRISNIASVVGYSLQHFQRLFREAYGITPHTYLQRIRMQQAALWLEKNEFASIKEISGLLGMEPSYFIRLFKKVYGISPGEFRTHVTK